MLDWLYLEQMVAALQCFQVLNAPKTSDFVFVCVLAVYLTQEVPLS